jgi:phosphatidylserine/phosphatidylglycerophosphate/cardiolipin synthase-like enzyme
MEIENTRLHSDRWAHELANDCRNAKKSIHLCSMSMQVPKRNTRSDWQELWDEWVRAKLRGVDVALWLAAPQSNAAATRGNGRAGAAAVAAGIKLRYVRGNKLLHAKCAIIDVERAWIGSGNFTCAAACENYETYLSISSPGIAQQLLNKLESLP